MGDVREGGDSMEELLLFLLLGVEGSPAVATFTLVLMPGAVTFSDGDVLAGAAPGEGLPPFFI